MKTDLSDPGNAARRQPLLGVGEQAEEGALRALYFAFFRFAAQ